jgi:hypothetical protein
MSLPEITAPIGTPLHLEAGHAFTPRSVFSELSTGAGHPRKRRLATVAPRIQAVSWTLDEAQMAAVDDWFENVLIVGTLPFAAYLVSEQGYLWWAAQWVEPYRAEILPAGHLWTVTGNLLLTGEGSATGPVRTSARVEFGAALDGTVSAQRQALGYVEFGAALADVLLARIEFGAALVAFELDELLREDSGYVLREDGGRIVREEVTP